MGSDLSIRLYEQKLYPLIDQSIKINDSNCTPHAFSFL